MLDLFDVFQPTDALADSREIGQRPAKPALIDVKLSASHGRFFHRFLRLLLAAHKQDLPAATGHLLQKFGRTMQLLHGLIEIDDINLVPLLKDKGLHLRIPALGLVPKVDPGLKELRH